MQTICPLPDKWNRIYEALMRAWDSGGRIGDPPPVPLILNGWVFSNDIQKKERWQATLAWAEERSLQHAIPALSDADFHRVNEPTSYVVGPTGGPLYLDWNFVPRARPSPEQAAAALERLRSSWRAVAGPSLSS